MPFSRHLPCRTPGSQSCAPAAPVARLEGLPSDRPAACALLRPGPHLGGEGPELDGCRVVDVAGVRVLPAGHTRDWLVRCAASGSSRPLGKRATRRAREHPRPCRPAGQRCLRPGQRSLAQRRHSSTRLHGGSQGPSSSGRKVMLAVICGTARWVCAGSVQRPRGTSSLPGAHTCRMMAWISAVISFSGFRPCGLHRRPLGPAAAAAAGHGCPAPPDALAVLLAGLRLDLERPALAGCPAPGAGHHQHQAPEAARDQPVCAPRAAGPPAGGPERTAGQLRAHRTSAPAPWSGTWSAPGRWTPSRRGQRPSAA